jgi:signal transduction histidine kinase
MKRFSQLSLLWKILLSTSAAITLLFGLVFWLVQRRATETTARSLEEEVRASFDAYESLWRARADMLSSVSRLLSTMSDVRAAFSTGDEATIRDTAGELWGRISDETAVFIVTDPLGRVIASLGGRLPTSLRDRLLIVPAAAKNFPDQTSGFMVRDRRLFQAVVTPVYVTSGAGQSLLNVLVAGFEVDAALANSLKQATGGSEFLFLSEGRVMAATLNERARNEIARRLGGRAAPRRASDGVIEYAPLRTELKDIEGKPVGELWILRSFEGARSWLAALRRDLILIWLAAVLAGFGLTYLLARRIVEPVKELDLAAAEVGRQNFDYRVRVSSEDELGRLARTFNAMCESIQRGRDELIRQERLSTIGRLSSSIVHDLRNPLAAIYGGAEMLVDSDLAPAQMKRLAANIYRSSRKIQELLQDLLNVSRGRTGAVETCRLHDVVAAGCEPYQAVAEGRGIVLSVDVPARIEVSAQRARMERVIQNLVGNAMEAVDSGGRVTVRAVVEDGFTVVTVSDTGPGIRPEIRARLFQPFVSAGKKGGLGLGLALSRQTVMDHGGDMWVESEPGAGARFVFRLPLTRQAALAGADSSRARL